jgi:hypothetical protein
VHVTEEIAFVQWLSLQETNCFYGAPFGRKKKEWGRQTNRLIVAVVYTDIWDPVTDMSSFYQQISSYPARSRP